MIALVSACSDDSVWPVIIDTDMGFDDVRAILLFLESDDIDIPAVTAIGNGLAGCPQGGKCAGNPGSVRAR
ncbi:MAG: hypothetical protein GY926_18915 [bacterium]|nr:hypothetical protein [bacterium]MCP4967290.1 hypothetical protein [bacterium]